MILAAHAVVGALCGSFLRRRRAVVPAAFASHLLLDVLTHEDPLDEDGGFRPAVLALDVFCTTAVLLVIARRHGPASSEVVGALAACLPDGEHFVLRGRKQVSLHGLLPHSLWPRVRLSLREQFVIAILAAAGVVALLPQAEAGAPDRGFDRGGLREGP